MSGPEVFTAEHAESAENTCSLGVLGDLGGSCLGAALKMVTPCPSSALTCLIPYVRIRPSAGVFAAWLGFRSSGAS